VKTFSLIACWTLAISIPAASQSFSEGKNLGQLRDVIGTERHQGNSFFTPRLQTALATRGPLAVLNRNSSPAASPVPGVPRLTFLPRWTPECLPFFCRIEHDFAQKNSVPFKFRLGSVEYVDWLEGKSDFPALPPH